jgi:hypothetical protein
LRERDELEGVPEAIFAMQAGKWRVEILKIPSASYSSRLENNRRAICIVDNGIPGQSFYKLSEMVTLVSWDNVTNGQKAILAGNPLR